MKSLEQLNKNVAELRATNFQESLGVHTPLYKNLPLYVTEEEYRKITGIQYGENDNFIITTTNNTYSYKNINDLIIGLKINLVKQDLLDMLNFKLKENKVYLSDKGKEEIELLLKQFD